MTGTGTQTRTTGVTTIALLVLRTGELKILPDDDLDDERMIMKRLWAIKCVMS